MDPDIRDRLEAVVAQPVADIDTLTGGCVGEVYRVTLANGDRLVAKIDRRDSGNMPIEASMLTYLNEQTRLPVPAVLYCDEEVLVMEHMPGASQFSAAAEADAAHALASLHSMSADTFGFSYDTLIGGLTQPNPRHSSWLNFFTEHRLKFMAGRAVEMGRLPASTAQRLDRLCEQIDQWLEEPDAPSLIHGDVWTTNVLAKGNFVRAFLDPAIYFAHSEIELSFITLFDTFGPAFFKAYEEHRPLKPGFFEERRHIYNLYPLLVHVRLFGGSYVSSVDRTLTHFGF